MVSDQDLPKRIINGLLDAYCGGPGETRVLESVSLIDPSRDSAFSSFNFHAYFDFQKITSTAILLRKEGPYHLRSLSMEGIVSRLRRFFAYHHYLIADEVSIRSFDHSYSDFLSVAGTNSLVAALECSELFHPTERLLLFPLTPVSVQDDWHSANFFIVSPDCLKDFLPQFNPKQDFFPDRMPPFGEPSRDEKVGAWLGVRGPSDEAAKKMKRAIIGALALAPIERERYTFVLRPAVRDYLRFKDSSCSRNSSAAHTPPLGENGLTIRQADHPWLDVLRRLLDAETPIEKRQRKALEYYYRAWFLEHVERCPLMFMALDAIFGQDGGGASTQKMKTGIITTLDANDVDDKIDIMMKLRNSVLHGGTPDVYDSSKYTKYYQKFQSDLVKDLSIVTAKCLRKHIFGDLFVPQPDPHEALISQYRASGSLPQKPQEHIVPEWP